MCLVVLVVLFAAVWAPGANALQTPQANASHNPSQLSELPRLEQFLNPFYQPYPLRKRRSIAHHGKQTPLGKKPKPHRKHRQKYGCKSWEQQTLFVCWGKMKRMDKN